MAGLVMAAIAKESGHRDTMAFAFLPAAIGAGTREPAPPPAYSRSNTITFGLLRPVT